MKIDPQNLHHPYALECLLDLEPDRESDFEKLKQILEPTTL